MPSKRVLGVLAALVGIVAIALGVYRWQASQIPGRCQICGRDIHKQTEFRIETAHGTIYACCPSCAIHHMINHPGEARKELATDFNSGRLIAAGSAYYHIGGDAQYCTAHKSPFKRTPMGVEVRTYDRCLPTLVAFANQDEAEAYRRQHGGHVVTYHEAIEDIRNQ